MAGGNIFRAVGKAGRADSDRDVADELPDLGTNDPFGLGDEAGAVPDWHPDGGGEAFDFADDAEKPRSDRTLIMAVLAIAAATAWLGWFGWANRTILAGMDPARISALVPAGIAPLLLLALIWLIVQRSSRAESARFAESAHLLEAESARLGARLVTINRELSLAREFVAAQARDLESVGRVAVERISQHGDRLAELVSDNGAQIDAIASVSSTALENMERLRGQLPVLAGSAKDMTNNIGNAGRIAQTQLSELIAGFNRLNEFGQASERQVIALRGRVHDTLGELEARSTDIDTASRERLTGLSLRADELHAAIAAQNDHLSDRIADRTAALIAEIESGRDRLDAAEAESLHSLRARLSALRDESANIGRSLRNTEATALERWQAAFARLETESAAAAARLADAAGTTDAELDRRRQAIEAGHQAALERIGAASAALDSELAGRNAAQLAQMGEMTARSDLLRGQLRGVEERIAAIADAGRAAESELTARVDLIVDRIGAASDQLAATDTTVTGLTDASVRLLELIQGAARHADEHLATAIGNGDDRLAEIEARARALREAVETARAGGEVLASQVAQTRATLGALHDQIDARTQTHGEALADLRARMLELDDAAAAAAERARNELTAAIAALHAASDAAIGDIETRGARSVETVAEQLGERSGAAIERAMRGQIEEIGGKLEQASAHAAGVSREAAMQLRGQLSKIDELVGNLETRVEQARVRASEQVDNDFSRRAALITESLNSNAIDITKALDSDVSDIAWAAYLRGDRGVFTRRAVKLLQAPEAREVTALYEGDRDFHEHVSRYIHDFEAMLRQLLSTRDGHAMGVTLLSSDMGKLYVALAQAIERLRD